jgi:hypothetical protein
MLWLSNLFADWHKLRYLGRYEFHSVVDNVQIYVVTCPELRKAMDDDGYIAFAIGEHICFRDRKSITKKNLRHEMAHVEQARTVFLFPIQYWLCDFFYQENPFELDAEDAETA